MVKIFPTDKNGNRIGPDKYVTNIHWEDMKKIPNLRWKESSNQPRSKSSDAFKAEQEIKNNPSTEFKVGEVRKYLKRLDNVEVIVEFVKGDERQSVITSAEKRINQIEKP